MPDQKELKTRKLKCIITGRVLTANKDYYNRKIEKLGSEENLKRTYTCREAKTMLAKGMSVDEIRKTLNIDTTDLTDIPPEIINEILIQKKAKLNRFANVIGSSTVLNTKTDPDVKKFGARQTKNATHKTAIMRWKSFSAGGIPPPPVH